MLSGGVGHGEGDVEAPGEGLCEVGLAAAGRSDQQDVGLGDLDVVVVAALGKGAALGCVAGLDPLVVVVDGDGEGPLGGLLADDVFLQEVEDLAGLGQLEAPQVSYFGECFFNDLVAEFNALVADVDAGPGDQLLDLLLALPTEGALQQVASVTDTCHGRSSSELVGLCESSRWCEDLPDGTPCRPELGAQTRSTPGRSHGLSRRRPGCP